MYTVYTIGSKTDCFISLSMNKKTRYNYILWKTSLKLGPAYLQGRTTIKRDVRDLVMHSVLPNTHHQSCVFLYYKCNLQIGGKIIFKCTFTPKLGKDNQIFIFFFLHFRLNICVGNRCENIISSAHDALQQIPFKVIMGSNKLALLRYGNRITEIFKTVKPYFIKYLVFIFR